MRNGRLTSISVAMLALAGCGGSAPTTSPELWCNGLCAAVQRCGFSDPTCASDCVTQRPGLARESTSGASAQEPCVANLSCQAVGGDDTAWKSELDACWQQAKTTVDITPHVRQVCAADTVAWFDCGYSYAIDTCEHDYAMWADEVLDGLAACQAMSSCDALQACEKSVFGSS